MKISSPAFRHGSDIPVLHTCDGANLSPPLAWSGVPREAKALVLMVDDREALSPESTSTQRVHWLVYDIPVATTFVGPNEIPRGGRLGTNDGERSGWDGPCPLVGRHRYMFTLYAVDIVLGKRGELTREQVMEAIDGHVVGEASLDGRYERRAGVRTTYA